MKGQQDVYYRYLADPIKLKMLSEEKFLEMIASIDGSIVENNQKSSHMKAVPANCSQDALNTDKITKILKNFNAVLDTASQDLKKDMVRSIIKKIHIQPSEKIWERKATDIKMWFDSEDVTKHFGESNTVKKYEVICDMVHSS